MTLFQKSCLTCILFWLIPMTGIWIICHGGGLLGWVVLVAGFAAWLWKSLGLFLDLFFDDENWDKDKP